RLSTTAQARSVAIVGTVATADVVPAAADWRDHVTLSAQDRARAEFVDYFRPPPGAASSDAHRYAFYANQLRAGLRVLFPHVDLGVEIQDTRLVHLPDDVSLGPPIGHLGPGALFFALSHDRVQVEPV